ncbi:APC family permease [Pseudoxanthomonas sacheonensis]|uniref:Arginine/agmatine antiporter n=1 Tax=Pseudoxanthomonas sacheonensis TaxID=443615 RepID=A0ABU1RV88_9GAMM|nr:amino acid permease [Pseudoxanthomonas sacheonensis]MDR6842687.1 APA family basic amino acid/polyamine antiporter [Pseudoxanthomonas sacheonensis]
MNDTKKIGFWTCTALVVGNTIGMGIFLLPASLAPYGYNAMIGWGITVVGCIALARVFARLARELAHADGPYGYVRSTLGDLPAYIALWCYWVSVWITNAALATGVVAYITAVVPELGQLQPSLFALGLLWTFVAINLFGVRTGGGVQIVTTTLKLLPMLAIALLGAWMLLRSPQAYVAHLPTKPIALSDAMAASTIALFAMLGIESATVPAAKVENPGRTIPRATIVGTLLTAMIYLIVSTVPLLLIPSQELAAAPAPFALLMDRFVGDGFGRWLALFVVISGLGALNGWTLLVGELTRTMADNGVLPTFLSRNNRRGAPAFALLVTAALASIMILMSYSKSLVSGFTFLSTVVTAANLPLYLCCSLALGILWWRGKKMTGQGIRDMLVIAIMGTAYVLFAFVGLGHEPFLLALGLGAAGLPLYLFMRLRPKTV